MAAIEIVQADITTLEVDAIVNAANATLLGGGGVDGAIHRVAGPELLAECITLGGCPTGQARITAGYNLPARFVIHTVGPVWHGGTEQEHRFLASCYRKCLDLAVENNCISIAFPAISCGVYGFPIDYAARIAMTETLVFVEKHKSIERVVFACFSSKTQSALEEAYRQPV